MEKKITKQEFLETWCQEIGNNLYVDAFIGELDQLLAAEREDAVNDFMQNIMDRIKEGKLELILKIVKNERYN